MPQQPDILILMTDQHNPYCLGCAGDALIWTPNIDALAAEGGFFNHAYTVCPVCMPARCSAVSGLYPHNHGFWMNFTEPPFPVERITFFRDLRAAGYRTAHVGKSHWFTPSFGQHYRAFDAYYEAIGLDHWVEIPGPYMTPFHPSAYSDHLRERGMLDEYIRSMANDMAQGQHEAVYTSVAPPEDHNDGMVGREAIAFIEGCAADEPFVLHASFPGPHTPLDAPGAYADMYNPADIILPANVPEGEYDAARKRRANYYGKISHIDHWVGRIVEAIRKRGTWENTLVVFFADHGDYMGAHGRYGKCGFEDESARVPLILRWPGHVPAGARVDALADILDVYPTLVGAAGGSVSPHRFGQNLLPAATCRVDQVHDAVFSEIGTKAPAYMVRTPRYKWFTSGPSHRAFLYDMENDPKETENLAALLEHKATVSAIRDQLRTFLMDTQVNFASTYRQLFRRVGVDPKAPGMADRLYAAMRSYHGMDA